MEQIAYKQQLPKSTIKLIEKIADNNLDVLSGCASAVLNNLLLINTNLPSKVTSEVTQKNCIVSKEKKALKRSNNFRTNILDLNLKQKVNNQRIQGETLDQQNTKSINNLPDLHGEANTAWHRTRLGEVAEYILRVRYKKPITDGDLMYLLENCLYVYDGKHEIARCDAAVF